MKVLYFSRDYSPHDHRFLSAIKQAGHSAHFLRLERRAAELDLRPLPEGVRQIEWAAGRAPFSWLRLPSLMKGFNEVIAEVKPDIVHAGPLYSAGFLAAKSHFHPLVLMSWGSDILWDAQRSPILRALTRYALGKADALIADCQAVKDKAEEFSFPGERIVTFPWGVDLGEFSPRGKDGGLRARLGWGDAFVLLHTRSWETIYGVETLARAFARVAKTNPSLRLLMLGEGSLDARLRAIFARANVTDQVHFAGQVAQSELPDYFRAADLYLSASRSDGSSVSLMEALASGLPSLVSDIPGNREWVQSGEGGWLFPVNRIAALARAIERAFEQRDKLPAMSKTARQTAEKRADWNKNKLGISQAYELAFTLKMG